MEHMGLHDLIKGVNVSELTVRIRCTVAMVLLSNLGEMNSFRSIFLHVLTSCIAEESNRKWTIGRAIFLIVNPPEVFMW